jgi:outer membrane protein
VESAANAWQTLATSRRIITVNQSAVDASSKALEGIREQAKVGTNTTLDVLDAHREVLNAHISLARAEYDEQVAVLELKASIGALTADGMHLSVKAYDPAEHYNDVRNKWIGFGN